MRAYVADTGVFVRCGGPENGKYQRLRRAVRQAGASLLIPRRVYEELGGDPDDDVYPSSAVRWQAGISEGWVEVATELDYSNPTISNVMDAARRFIANETNRSEHLIEKADTALVGLAAQLLDHGAADTVVVLTTDKPAGRAATQLLPAHGFEDRIEYRYASTDFLESCTASDFPA